MAGRSVTTGDIADLAGVSKTTVSFVLNRRCDVAIPEHTRARVLKIARELDYQPDRIARALRTGRTHMIALWTYGLYEGYYTHTFRHMREQLKKCNFDPQLVETDELVDEQASWRKLDLWPVDGIIVFESPRCVDAYLDANPSDHKPIVSTGAYWSPRTDFVGLDLRSGTIEAVKHLLNIGRRRIAYLTPEWAAQPGDSRRDAYAEMVQEAGFGEEYIVTTAKTVSDYRSQARSKILDYIKARGCPEAIFCFDDEMAVGALRALHDLGIRVPDDVALVGCDGIEETAYHMPAISTISMPIEQMCEIAWQFLQRRMDSPTVQQQQAILKPSLVIRESSGRCSSHEQQNIVEGSLR